MKGRFVINDDIKTTDIYFKQRFIYSFPNGCFIPDDFKNKVISDHESIDLLILLKPKNFNINVEDYTYSFDDVGNLIKIKHSSGNWWKYEYDCNNRIKLVDNNGYWYKYEYDEKNNVIKEESSNGSRLKYSYDDNNLIKQECWNGNWWKYEYDEINVLITQEYYSGPKNTYHPEQLWIGTELMNYLKLSTFVHLNE